MSFEVQKRYYILVGFLGVLSQNSYCLVRTDSNTIVKIINDNSVKGYRKSLDAAANQTTLALAGVPYILSLSSESKVRYLAWEDGTFSLSDEKNSRTLFAFSKSENNMLYPVCKVSLYAHNKEKVSVAVPGSNWENCSLNIVSDAQGYLLRIFFTDSYGTRSQSLESSGKDVTFNGDKTSKKFSRWKIEPAYDVSNLTEKLPIDRGYQLLKIPSGDSLLGNPAQECYTAENIAALYKIHVHNAPALAIFKAPIQNNYLGFLDSMPYAQPLDITVSDDCYVTITGIKGFYIAEINNSSRIDSQLQLIKDQNKTFSEDSISLGNETGVKGLINKPATSLRIQAPIGENNTPLFLGNIKIDLTKTALALKNRSSGIIMLSKLLEGKDILHDRFKASNSGGNSVSITLSSTLLASAEKIQKSLESIAQGAVQAGKSIESGLTNHGESIEKASKVAAENLRRAAKDSSRELRIAVDIVAHSVEKASSDFTYAVDTLRIISQTTTKDAQDALALLGRHLECSSNNISESLRYASDKTEQSAKELSAGIKKASSSFSDAFANLTSSLDKNTADMSEAIVKATENFEEGMSALKSIKVRGELGCIIV